MDLWQFNAQSEKNFYPDGSYDYETDFRPYDEVLGRFRSVDLLSDEFTGINGYQFGYNNPINFNDPTGLLSMRVVTRFIFTGPLYNTIFNNFASGFLNNANKQQIDVAVAFGGGVKDAVVRNVRALTVDLPETLTGLASLTTPVGQVQAIVGANMLYENTKQDWNSGDPKKRANIIGNVVGEIGFGIAGSKGAGIVAKGLGTAAKATSYGLSRAAFQILGRGKYNRYIWGNVAKLGNKSLISNIANIPTQGGAYLYELVNGQYYVGETSSFFARNANHTGWLYGTSAIQESGLGIANKQFFNVSGKVSRKVAERYLKETVKEIKNAGFINKKGFINDKQYFKNYNRIKNQYPNLSF